MIVIIIIIINNTYNVLTNYHFRSGIFKQKICVQQAVTIHFLTMFNKATVTLSQL